MLSPQYYILTVQFSKSSAGTEIHGGTMDHTLERSTMRKVYLRLLPFAVLSYVLACIDRINVSFAGLTMRGDLGMPTSTFGFAVGMFYWGYFIFEVPSNVIMERVGARIWIARIMITWGILAASQRWSLVRKASLRCASCWASPRLDFFRD
jgi:sugar phosphate permease